MKQFYVYILSSKTGTLYTGVTNNLERRLYEHKHKLVPGVASKYGCDRLMYYDVFPTAGQAIAAEKRIKGWTRAKKVALILTKNPKWVDLSEDWDRAKQDPDAIPPSDGGS
jgi:putative endonuclease